MKNRTQIEVTLLMSQRKLLKAALINNQARNGSNFPVIRFNFNEIDSVVH